MRTQWGATGGLLLATACWLLIGCTSAGERRARQAEALYDEAVGLLDTDLDKASFFIDRAILLEPKFAAEAKVLGQRLVEEKNIAAAVAVLTACGWECRDRRERILYDFREGLSWQTDIKNPLAAYM